MTRTLWRELLYRELEAVQLDGEVLDLGGSRKSGYHALLRGEHTMRVVNLDAAQGSDYMFDLEQPFPIPDASFDHVLALNVLEHIFNYQNMLDEAHRILKPGGTLVLAVPFLIQLHPSPHDHWRFSKETLERLLIDRNFREVNVRAIGTGIFGATSQLQHNLYRFGPLQAVSKWLARVGDAVLGFMKSDSVFSKEYYPLGYVVTAKK